MKIIGFVAMLSLLSVGCSNNEANAIEVSKHDSIEVKLNEKENIESNNGEDAMVPQWAQILIDSYPDAKLRYENNQILFPDGYAVVYDDGKEKTFNQQLEESDIEDSFAMQYYTGGGQPPYQADGGRSRNESFFKKMYGSTREEVHKNLTKINWFGKRVEVTTVNGVDKKLQAVMKELSSHSELKKYLKTAGAWVFRNVRGAGRLSAHSYGIAIDIGVGYSNFWQWSNPKANENTKITYKNKIPEQIALIFEKYGFVWGGRWYHYDTMHFEYRPEIINASKKSGELN